jgi:DNA topoisomerase-1
MAKNLLIVESPAKAKTINKYLGKDFQVLASYGHVRDLVPREGAVDPESGFAMRYEVIDKNQKHVDAIAKAAARAEALYLATDLDREGEAISWHISEILRERGLLDGKDLHRVVFSEITPRAIRQAIAEPRRLSHSLVDAQQARRALDYLVGFNLSPVLWRKVQAGLSAGRVQSPALRMIVEREEEIEAFIRREYWSVEAALRHPQGDFGARLTRLDGRKFEQFDLDNEKDALAARERLLKAAGGMLEVIEVSQKERKRRPAPPFTTSTLQQEAARKLGMGTSRSMRIAQGLYEGVALGEEGVQGLITYMRTDSVSLSGDALSELREVIERQFGKQALPEKPNFYRTKSKNAQEAHEAIRPTSALRTPASLAKYLTHDQLRLYELIWKRTVACQMIPATLSTTAVDLACGERHLFRASGTTVLDPGFLAVYEEGRDQKSEEDDDEGRRLPPLAAGDRVPLVDIVTSQHFTEPPPRYSEASLVKALEEHGIGRPSTYAAIIQTLLNRKYVELDSRRFRPTDVGRAVSKFLASHFTRYVDYDFTAKLEDELDAVARGEEEWVPLMQRFWRPFKELVADKLESVDKGEATGARELGTDPKSGKPVSVRLGRYGPFVQIGTREDEDKPTFASLRPGQSMHTITLEEALKLFELPRTLGEGEDGEPISVGIGRFGPFVRQGKLYASIKGEDDPYTITLERARALIEEKKRFEANRVIKSFGDGSLQVLNGRFGPYVTDGEKLASVPKGQDAAELDEDACRALLAEKGKPVKKRGAAKKAPAKKPAAKKAPAKKTAAKKAAAKKAPAKKAASKSGRAAAQGKTADTAAPARSAPGD